VRASAMETMYDVLRKGVADAGTLGRVREFVQVTGSAMLLQEEGFASWLIGRSLRDLDRHYVLYALAKFGPPVLLYTSLALNLPSDEMLETILCHMDPFVEGHITRRALERQAATRGISPWDAPLAFQPTAAQEGDDDGTVGEVPFEDIRGAEMWRAALDTFNKNYPMGSMFALTQLRLARRADLRSARDAGYYIGAATLCREKTLISVYAQNFGIEAAIVAMFSKIKSDAVGDVVNRFATAIDIRDHGAAAKGPYFGRWVATLLVLRRNKQGRPPMYHTWLAQEIVVARDAAAKLGLRDVVEALLEGASERERLDARLILEAHAQAEASVGSE